MTTNNLHQEAVDPFSEDLEAEAVRRGHELMQSGKRAPVLLVSEQWRRFLDVNHRRTIIDRKWKAAAEALRRIRNLRDGRIREFGPTMARVRGELQQLCTADERPGCLSSAAVFDSGRLEVKVAMVLEAVAVLRKGSPHVQAIADRLEAEARPLAVLQAEWKARHEEFLAIHQQLRVLRVAWGMAWDELEMAAIEKEDEARLHTRLFLRAGVALNRSGIPAVVPVLGLADQMRGLWKWAKAKLAAKPLVVAAMSAMAAATLTLGGVAGLYVWHTHAGHSVASVTGAGVNRH